MFRSQQFPLRFWIWKTNSTVRYFTARRRLRSPHWENLYSHTLSQSGARATEYTRLQKPLGSVAVENQSERGFEAMSPSGTSRHFAALPWHVASWGLSGHRTVQGRDPSVANGRWLMAKDQPPAQIDSVNRSHSGRGPTGRSRTPPAGCSPLGKTDFDLEKGCGVEVSVAGETAFPLRTRVGRTGCSLCGPRFRFCPGRFG